MDKLVYSLVYNNGSVYAPTGFKNLEININLEGLKMNTCHFLALLKTCAQACL